MLHIDGPLTDVSTAYIQSQTNYVAGKVFPQVNVQKQSDVYFVYDKADFLRVEAKPRAPGSRVAQAGYKVSNSPYYAKVVGLGKAISDQDMANTDAPQNLEADAAKYLSQQLLLKKDLDFLSTYFKTGVWTDATPSTKWGTAGTDPIVDITTQIEVISARTGIASQDMTVTIAADAWAKMKNHPAVLERVKYSGSNLVPAKASTQAVASALEVKEVIVTRAVYNSAVEGATGSFGYMATANALLITYAPSEASLLTPSAGYLFNWSGLLGSGSAGIRMSKYWEDNTRSWQIEGEMAYDMKVVSTDCGVFMHTLY